MIIKTISEFIYILDNNQYYFYEVKNKFHKCKNLNKNAKCLKIN